MAQNTEIKAHEDFRALFESLTESNQQQALVVLKALVFAQGAVGASEKETA